MTSSRTRKTGQGFVKGVPVEEILRLCSRGHWYGSVQYRHPKLSWVDIDEVLDYESRAPVAAGLEEGKSVKQIAADLGCSPRHVLAIKHRIARNKYLRRQWDGLSVRAAGILQRLGYRNIRAARKNPPAKEQFYDLKGTGPVALTEIENLIPLKPSCPSNAPGGISPEAVSVPRRRSRPSMYATKADHFLQVPKGHSAPRAVREVSRFFEKVVKSAADVPLGEILPSHVPCMAGPSPRRWCLGIVDVWRTENPSQVHWECAVCGKGGVIRGPETMH